MQAPSGRLCSTGRESPICSQRLRPPPARPAPSRSSKPWAHRAPTRSRSPAGYRADVLIRWGDEFANTDGQVFRWGYNNDFLAYFPLDGSKEGLLFANHEYPSPFFQHGNTNAATKTPGEIAIEQEAVGNSIIHIKRDSAGVWKVVSPSPYSRRITGATPVCEMTGPITDSNGGDPHGTPLIVGDTANGSVANCSGGITPWGTALSCEENYADYG